MQGTAGEGAEAQGLALTSGLERVGVPCTMYTGRLRGSDGVGCRNGCDGAGHKVYSADVFRAGVRVSTYWKSCVPPGPPHCSTRQGEGASGERYAGACGEGSPKGGWSSPHAS